MTKLRAGISMVSLALLVAVLTGCVAMNPLVKDGPGINFAPEEVQKYAADQQKVLEQLYVLAGVPKPPANDDWDKVIRAGMDYADQKCEAYMHALFRLNRDRNTAVAQIGLVGTAVAGISAAVSATAKEIAILAIAFGLASATVDNLSSNLLYEMEPSSVRSLVKGLQQGYRANLPPGYNSQPAAITVIRRYTELCLPANIEAEVNLAVKKSVPDTKRGDATTGEPPAVTHSEVLSRLESTYRFDDASQRLRNFWQPGGTVSPANEKVIREWMAKNKLADESLTFFIRSEKYEKERAQAVKELLSSPAASKPAGSATDGKPAGSATDGKPAGSATDGKPAGSAVDSKPVAPNLTTSEIVSVVGRTGADFPLGVYLEGGESVTRLVKLYGQREYFMRHVELLKKHQLITCPEGSSNAGDCRISDLGRQVMASFGELRR